MNNKNFLSILIIISLFTAIFSANKIYNKIKLHLYGDSIEIITEKKDINTNSEKPNQTNTQESKENKEEIVEKDKLPQTANNIENEKKNTEKSVKALKKTFEYQNKKAKKVMLTGSFLKWKEKAMKNKNGKWTAEEYILPGNYFYHFIVDGKKTLDPNAPKTPMGESLVEVK
jgi:hypothetical protein